MLSVRKTCRIRELILYLPIDQIIAITDFLSMDGQHYLQNCNELELHHTLMQHEDYTDILSIGVYDNGWIKSNILLLGVRLR